MGKGIMIQNFRKKVLEKRKDISDKDILLSDSCHAYIENLIEAVTKLYNQKIRLHMEWTDNKRIAYANSRYDLFLNINNKIVLSAEDCVDKVVLIKGLSIHECGHLLFTDFHLLQSAFQVFLEQHQLFPAPKCSEYTEWLTDAAIMDDADIMQWFEAYKRLENSIEDGFIEYKLLDLLPGEGQCLYALRKVQAESFESVKVMKSKGYSNPTILFNCILMLAKYNTVLMDADDTSEPAVAALVKNYDLIQQAVHAEKSYDRVKLINEIFCRLYCFLKEDTVKKRYRAEKSSNRSNTDNKFDSNSGQDNDSDGSDSNNGQGNGSDNSEDSCDDEESNSESNGNTAYGELTSDALSSMLDNLDAMLEHSPAEMPEEIDTGSGSVLNDKNINQKPLIPARNRTEKIENIIMGLPSEETAQIPSPQDKLLVDNIANNIAEQAVMDEAETDLAEELKKEVAKFNFSELNKNIPIEIIRKDPSEMAYLYYDKAMQEISFLVKKTVNELKNKIKDQQHGGKLNGLYNGRYLDQSNLSRFDMRIMCKNNLPADIPDMAISILIDGSGSMETDNKAWYAILTALTIYHVCRELDIPVMVYSHNALFKVEITALADFNSVDGKDKYRICDLKPFNGNRDGMALRFCSEKLANRKEKNKFQMIISDGLPSAYQSNAEGRADIRNVLIDYSKRNVKYIAFGLGDDQKRIEDIYSQDLSSRTAAKFIQSDAPVNLPSMFVKVIKELIKI